MASWKAEKMDAVHNAILDLPASNAVCCSVVPVLKGLSSHSSPLRRKKPTVISP